MSKWLGSAVLAGALLVPTAGWALPVHAQPRKTDQKPAATKPVVVPENEKSDQTLREAIDQLEAIKSRVHAAARQYGGHRGKADQYIEQAVQELRAALKFDQQHEAPRK